MKFKAYNIENKKWLHDFRIHPDGTVMQAEGSSNGKWEYSTKPMEKVRLYKTGRLPIKGKKVLSIKFFKFRLFVTAESQEE